MKIAFNSKICAVHTAILLTVFCLSCSILKAQVKDSLKLIPKASISLKDGATLFSSDKSFNRQISNKKIIRGKAAVAYTKNKQGGKNLEMTEPRKGSGHITKDSLKEKEKGKPAKKDKKKVSYFFLNNNFNNKYG